MCGAAVRAERLVVLARSDPVAKASVGMSCFGTMYTYLVRRSCPSLARIESDGEGLPRASLARWTLTSPFLVWRRRAYLQRLSTSHFVA